MLLAGASSASAYVQIDSRCILRAYTPWSQNYTGPYYVSGEVDCSGNSYPVPSQIEVCSQVYNSSTNQWYTVSGSCAETNVITEYVNQLTILESGVCGHEYRTWDWGYLADDGASATYTSSGYVNCTQPATPTEAPAGSASQAVQPTPGLEPK